MSPSDAARAYFERPHVEALRVYADALVEAGDPRGEFLQLSLLDAPTPEQQKRRASLERRLGGKLVGPARPFLRTWRFGADGLVASAATEARLLPGGFDALCALSPRLRLSVTAMRTSADVQRVAALPLRRIHGLAFESCAMTDETLCALAPALAGVKHLSLAFNDITARGLAALAPHALELDSLALGTSTRGGGALGDAWVRCLCEMPGFRNLKLVSLFNDERRPAPALLARLRRQPELRLVKLGRPPHDLAALEPVLAAPRQELAAVDFAESWTAFPGTDPR